MFYAGTKPYLRGFTEEFGRELSNVLDLKDRGGRSPTTSHSTRASGILRVGNAAAMLAVLGFITCTKDVMALRARGIKAVTAAICALIDQPIVFQTYEDMGAALSANYEERFIYTGFSDVDNLLRGFERSGLVILAARP